MPRFLPCYLANYQPFFYLNMTIVYSGCDFGLWVLFWEVCICRTEEYFYVLPINVLAYYIINQLLEYTPHLPDLSPHDWIYLQILGKLLSQWRGNSSSKWIFWRPFRIAFRGWNTVIGHLTKGIELWETKLRSNAFSK